jgi:DNA-binding GntR family transcriptional regulator
MSSIDEPVGRLSNEQLYRTLRARIIHLELAPGTRLTEETLAREFGISRTPVRRVLDRLAHDGLVTINPGSGASVSTIDFHAMREVWALRLKIVDLVGDFVRLPAPEAIIERLEALLARLDTVTSAEELAPLYDDYHDTVLDLLTNGPLRSIYDQLYAQTARAFVQTLPNLDLDEEIRAIRDEITSTVAACRAGDPHRLAEVRSRHMEDVVRRLDDALSLAPRRRPRQ